jgi:hypothetical protein
LINSRLEADFREKKRTLDDVLAERASEKSLVMTPAQARAHQEREARREMMEREREAQLERFTNDASRQFDKVHDVMFSGRNSHPSDAGKNGNGRERRRQIDTEIERGRGLGIEHGAGHGNGHIRKPSYQR